MRSSNGPVTANRAAGAAALAMAHDVQQQQHRAQPPTTASLRRPGSALRRIASNSGSAAQQQQALQVDFRPVTQHGMMGMRSGSAGPGRQFADKAFFLAEIRNKITQVRDELAKLNSEVEQRHRDQSTHHHLEREQASVSKEVQKLEAQLADFNLAYDKVRTGADVADLKSRCDRLNSANVAEKNNIDEIFLVRSNQDKLCEQIEHEIEAMKSTEDRMMSTKGQETYDQYLALQTEARQTLLHVYRREEVLSRLRASEHAAENKLRNDAYKTHFRGLELSKRRLELEERRRELVEETSGAQTIEEMRERLLLKTKEDSAIVNATQQHQQRLEQSIEALQAQIREKEAQKENFKQFEAISAKYEALYQRDKKMQEFIDKFEFTQQSDATQKASLQNMILALLEHISEQEAQNAASQDVDTPFSEMRNNLQFKEQRLQNSQNTLETVKKELERRRAELAQVQTLGEKIDNEVVSLKQKMDEMQHEAHQFDHIEELKEREAHTKQSLEQDLAIVQEKRAAMHVHVQQLSAEFESIKRKLSENDTWNRLDLLEQKMRTCAQTAYSLQSCRIFECLCVYACVHDDDETDEFAVQTSKHVHEKASMTVSVSRFSIS